MSLWITTLVSINSRQLNVASTTLHTHDDNNDQNQNHHEDQSHDDYDAKYREYLSQPLKSDMMIMIIIILLITMLMITMMMIKVIKVMMIMTSLAGVPLPSTEE